MSNRSLHLVDAQFRSSAGDWLVAELKRGRASPAAIELLDECDQLARTELAAGGEEVLGLLLAFGFDTAVRRAVLDRSELRLLSWTQLGLPWELR